MPGRHQKKEVADAVDDMETAGWRIEPRGGHVWARAFCQYGCCQVSISSTPRNPGDHAKHLRKSLERCPGEEVEADA